MNYFIKPLFFLVLFFILGCEQKEYVKDFKVEGISVGDSLLTYFSEEHILEFQRKNDIKGNRLRKADKLARKYLGDAKKSLGDQTAFYLALEKCLHNYLKARLNIQTSEMSKERISQLLQDRGVTVETTAAFLKLLESCEFARYTPSSSDAMQHDYEQASRVISEIDKQL